MGGLDGVRLGPVGERLGRGVERAEDAQPPKVVEQSRAAEHLDHLAIRLGQAERDPGGRQAVVELGEDGARGDVEVADRLRVEDEPLDPARIGGDDGLDLSPDPLGVGEEQRRLDAIDDQPRLGRGRRVALDVVPGRRWQIGQGSRSSGP